MTATTKRPYLVHTKGAPLPRVIIAQHPAQAVRHAASQDYTVETATALQVAFLMRKGVNAEEAGEAPAQADLTLEPGPKAATVPEADL